MKQCKQCGTEYEPKRSTSECCSDVCRSLRTRTRSLMKDLPADVQAAIERDCAENNGGARDASHNRAAMIERALDYQAKFGGQPAPTGKCQTCGGPVQHPTVVKCLKCCTGQVAPDPGPTPDPAESGPLSVYSDRRWAYLQDKGYVWAEALQHAYSASGLIRGVTVPGDPGYESEAA